jgi:DNA-directed RNA polymerase specialized sigma24 family protein
MAFVKVADFAKHMGVSPQAVRKAISAGRLKDSAHRDGRSWMVDDRLAAAEWDQNTAPQFQRGRMAQRQQAQAVVSPPPSTAQGKMPSQSQAAAVRTWYQAKLLELDLKERNGQLVPAADMERVRFESGKRVRDAVLRLGQQMIGDIARAVGGLTPEQRSEVLLAIERHHVKALEALANGNS